jgi:hypothetical protein
LEGLRIDNVGIFCGHSEYFITIRYVSCPFGIVCGHLVIFFSVLVRLYQDNLATLTRVEAKLLVWALSDLSWVVQFLKKITSSANELAYLGRALQVPDFYK